jgi:hypothetical protein
MSFVRAKFKLKKFQFELPVLTYIKIYQVTANEGHCKRRSNSCNFKDFTQAMSEFIVHIFKVAKANQANELPILCKKTRF